MTVIIVERSRRDHALMLADTRLSQGRDVLTDKMTKIFVLGVRGFHSDRRSNLRKAFDASIAVGFTGSSSVAFATVSLLQNYLMSMIVPLGKTSPTMQQVANFAARLMLENYKDFGAIWRSPPDCGLVLVGSLPSEREISAYYVTTELSANTPSFHLYKHDFTGNNALALGSGKDRFSEIVAESERSGTQRSLFGSLLTQIRENRVDVGGAIQAATIGLGTVSLPHVLIPRPDRGEYEADALFIGRGHPEFTTIGDCLLGNNQAVSIMPYER